MTPEEIGMILIAALLVIVTPLFILAIRKELKKAPSAEKIRSEEDALFEIEPEIKCVRAEVIDMACGVDSIGYQGYKLPRAVKSFVVSFKTEDGEILRLAVEEEYYHAFDVGQVGALELINGELGSFELDEA